MDYAIGFYFDKLTEDKFTDIIKDIAHKGANKYMLDTKIPPHVTVSFFCTDDVVPVIAALDEYCALLKPGDLFWASLGVFKPNVIFSAPVLNEYLMNACINTNQVVKHLADVGDNGHYLPYQWVPHTALAVKLNQEELKTAFDIAVQHFSAFGGVANRLFLAECNPYKELRTWQLTSTN